MSDLAGRAREYAEKQWRVYAFTGPGDLAPALADFARAAVNDALERAAAKFEAMTSREWHAVEHQGPPAISSAIRALKEPT